MDERLQAAHEMVEKHRPIALERRTCRAGAIVALTLALLVAGGCSRASESSSDMGGVTPGTSPEPATTSSGTGTDTASTAPAPATSAGVAATTDPTGSTVPRTDPDSAPNSVDGAEAYSSDDPWPVTIGAVIGASVLLLVAVLWMVRMNRQHKGRDDAIDQSRSDSRPLP